ncbi:MAG: T9SS type A sorting domain-containing protein [Bacteroidetes bacterium]|nr:MAG: T9SS type A sorting domain-containing protein [Bacteroidota bacterium]
MKKIFTLVFFTSQAIYVFSQTCNALDPGFASGGIRVGLSSNDWLDPKNLIVQPDNKIIQFGNLYSNGNHFSMVRYNSDGSFDNSFGQGGKVISSISTNEWAYNGTLQTDGKIVIAGSIGNGTFALARYYQDGTPDNSFGTYGTVVAASADQSTFASALAIQSDGKIVAVGSTTRTDDCINSPSYPYCPNHFSIFRFTSNGNLDNSFGQNGEVTTPVGPNHFGYASSVVIQPNGKIVVAGLYLYGLEPDYYGSYYFASAHFAMVRYNSNGVVDSSFGKNGVVTDASDFQGTSAMTLQADGKLLVTGYGGRPFEIERYNSDGTPDSSFATYGKQSNDFDSWTSSILVLPNRKIVAAGAAHTNFLIARLNADGSFDTSFNNNGKLSMHLGPIGSYDNAVGIALQGNHLIVGGSSYYNGGYGDSRSQLIVRLLDSIRGLSVAITPRSPLFPCPGNSTKLAVNQTGSIQWFKNGSPIAGATDTIYTAYENADYSVSVQNAKGCGESDPVHVLTNGLPVTITPSGSLIFCAGDSVILTINQSGNVQWYKNNISIPGANGDSYTAKDEGYYFVSVQNAKGCGQSPGLNVNINPVRPPITWDGTNLLTTSSNYAYQWYHNGDSIPGASSYLLKPTEQGIYKVVVRDYRCNNTSDEFNLNCNVINVPHPSISWNGSALTTTGGFSEYQWFLNGDSIPGAHSSVFSISQLGAYKVTVTGNFSCQNTSGEFTLSCNVLGPPTPVNIWDGKKFTTMAGYTHYQWYQNDTAIAGANSDTYTPGLTQFGYYKVVVTDKYNCASTSEKQPYFVTALGDIAVGDATLHYYPNPVRSVLNVDIAHVGRNKLQADLYDLSGRLVQRKLLSQMHNQLRVDGLSSGLYQLVIFNGTEKFATKIAVIK